MESAVQEFVQRPELCQDDSAGIIERASFALIEYLEGVLAGKPVAGGLVSPVPRRSNACGCGSSSPRRPVACGAAFQGT
jgi:chemosensory pili system protein ChpA (sensor histidine kinase/response regulator)